DSATNLQLDGVNIEMPQNGAAFQSGDTSSVERDLLMLDGSNIEQLGGTGVKGLSLGENNDTTTVSALPTCTSSLVGRIYKVSDSTAVTTDGQACAGSGTNTAIAMCGNTGAGTYGWKCH
ncbi:MAG: hypothetical protein ACREQE_07625, partial [Candidatus Binataceae bacterium]